MVKVTFRFWEEIIIHESIQHDLDELTSMQTVGVQVGGLTRPLNWAEGILFIASSMPPTEDIIREQLEGKIHWSSVVWALMPDYQKVIKIKETNVRIPIINCSTNNMLSEVARFLKKSIKQ